MSRTDSVDRITEDTLKELVGRPGPWATITLPTARTGPEVRQGPLRLRNLADRALAELGTLVAPAELEPLAEKLDALRRDHDFWQRQADGLVLLASPTELHTFRIAAPLPEAVRVGADVGLRDLALHLDADEYWYIVAISQNNARLLEATGTSVEELPQEGIPAGSDDALGDLERQRRLSFAAQGGGQATFHGHGGGREDDKIWLEKYLRQVADGLDSHSARPADATVVLAGVPAVVTSLRSVWRARGLLPGAIDGNPSAVSNEELHAAAAPLVEAHRRSHEAGVIEQIGSSGRGLRDHSDILRAAAEGRVDVLYLGDDANEREVGEVDAALHGTLAHGGSVATLHALDRAMVAIARY